MTMIEDNNCSFLRQNSFWKTLVLRVIKSCNVALMTLSFAIMWYTVFANDIAAPFYRKGNWMVIFLFFAIYILCGRTYDAFLVSYNRISEMIYSQMLSMMITDVLMYIVTWLLNQYVPSILAFVIMLLAQLGVSVVWSVSVHVWYYHTFQPKQTYIVWDKRRGMTDLIDAYGLNKKFQVVGNCSAQECVGDINRLATMEAVFLTGVESSDRNHIVEYCVEHAISVFVIPEVGDVMMSGAKKMHLFHLPILKLERYCPSPEFLFLKRMMDIALSVIGLVLTSPIMIITAIFIHMYDKGPVFYKQKRLTKDGKTFEIVKFRSMRVDAESDGVARLSTGTQDDRITPIGRKIRACRIDELPQLLNILKGDMSIVGPRPERPEIAWDYEKQFPEFKLRLQAKCGLTGYAQVYGKYNTSPQDKLRMDLMYLASPSIVEDLKIMLATVKILFLPASTEGVK